MAFEDRRNRVQLPFVPDSKVVLNIPMGGKILRGSLILTGVVTIAGATANGNVVGEGGPINLIQRIKLFATAAANSRYVGGTIVDCSPRSLLRYAIMQHNGKFIGDQNGSYLGNGANGNYPVYLSIPIYFADSNMRNQVGTALNADTLDSQGNPIWQSLQLEIDTGDITSCFAGNNGAVTYALNLQWVDDRLGLTGDTFTLQQEDHIALVQASQERMLDPAMPQSGLFTSWLMMAESGWGTTYTLNDNVLQRVVATGPTFNFDEYAQDIRQDMLDDEWIDPATNAAGLYFIDWTHGALGNANPAPAIQLQLKVANPSGPNGDCLRIFTRRYYPTLS